MANIDSNKANRSNTAYLINSVQKTMTATMFMQAVKNKKVKLSDKLSKFYPEAPAASKITMNQLLHMTSGLIHNDTSYGTPKFKNNQAGIKYDLKKTKFDSKYYNKRSYQPINYVLLAGIIEKVNHQSYENIFNSTFIKKLGLKQTSFIWSKNLSRLNYAKGYGEKSGEITEIIPNLNELHGEFGTGSIVMTNSDLYKTAKAMLDGTLLDKATCNSLFQAEPNGNYSGGYYNYPTYHSTNGSGNGYTTYFRISNDGKTALIIQANYLPKGYFELRSETNTLMESLVNS